MIDQVRFRLVVAGLKGGLPPKSLIAALDELVAAVQVPPETEEIEEPAVRGAEAPEKSGESPAIAPPVEVPAPPPGLAPRQSTRPARSAAERDDELVRLFIAGRSAHDIAAMMQLSISSVGVYRGLLVKAGRLPATFMHKRHWPKAGEAKTALKATPATSPNPPSAPLPPAPKLVAAPRAPEILPPSPAAAPPPLRGPDAKARKAAAHAAGLAPAVEFGAFEEPKQRRCDGCRKIFWAKRVDECICAACDKVPA